MATIEVHDGKQLTAGRALAGLGTRELALAARTSSRTIHRLETSGAIHVAEKKRHGCVQRALWEQITAALAAAGGRGTPGPIGRPRGRRRPAPGAAPNRCSAFSF
jgi:hypothetical protein